MVRFLFSTNMKSSVSQRSIKKNPNMKNTNKKRNSIII